MARKGPISYADVELSVTDEGTVAAPARDEPTTIPARIGRPPLARTLKEASSPVMLYLEPTALKSLKRYALDQNTKVHSLLLDAVEAWFKSHGLQGPVRVKTAVAGRSRGDQNQ